MDLSVIIVTYNSKQYLDSCLGSLMNSSNGIEKEILVVDNASADGGVKFVRSKFQTVNVIENLENIGFAAGNNAGAKAAKGRYLLFLNPDTVVEKDALVNMLSFMERNADAGIIGPKLLYPDGTLQLSCRKFYTIISIAVRRTFLNKIFNSSKVHVEHLMADWDHNSTRKVDWVLAACMMARREDFEKAGCFDEKYRLYFEDVDLCYRIKKMGKNVYYFPDSVVHHHHQRDSAKEFSIKTIWHIQSAVRFFRKFGWRL